MTGWLIAWFATGCTLCLGILCLAARDVREEFHAAPTFHPRHLRVLSEIPSGNKPGRVSEA